MHTVIRKLVCASVLATAIVIPAMSQAAIYSAVRLTHVAAGYDGSVFLKWSGSPNPGPCGVNSGWVKISAGDSESIKALAFSMYFSGTPARIDTAGCDGTYERVITLYSPTG